VLVLNAERRNAIESERLFAAYGRMAPGAARRPRAQISLSNWGTAGARGAALTP